MPLFLQMLAYHRRDHAANCYLDTHRIRRVLRVCVSRFGYLRLRRSRPRHRRCGQRSGHIDHYVLPHAVCVAHYVPSVWTEFQKRLVAARTRSVGSVSSGHRNDLLAMVRRFSHVRGAAPFAFVRELGSRCSCRSTCRVRPVMPASDWNCRSSDNTESRRLSLRIRIADLRP